MAARLRIAARRKALGLSQVDLADRVGVDRTTVLRCEKGESTPRPWYRPLWAAALEISLEELDEMLRDEESDVNRRTFLRSGLATTAGVAIAGSPLARFGTSDVGDLTAAVRRATRLEQASQFAALEVVLPGLLVEATQVVGEARPSVAQQAGGLLAQVQGLQAWQLIKKNRPIDAEAAARTALQTAQQVNDVVVVGAVLRCLGEVHMRAGRYGVACDLAVEAAELVRRSGVGSEDALVIMGAGYLSGAMASARGGDAAGASELLHAADVCAHELGADRSSLAVFGPSNVDIHRVAIPVELGDPISALQQAERIHLQLPPELGERTARYLIDLARALAAQGEDSEAVHVLLRAEQAAPEEARGHRLTRILVADLLARERRSRTPELRSLADRCQVLERAT